MKRYHWFVGRK